MTDLGLKTIAEGLPADGKWRPAEEWFARLDVLQSADNRERTLDEDLAHVATHGGRDVRDAAQALATTRALVQQGLVEDDGHESAFRVVKTKEKKR